MRITDGAIRRYPMIFAFMVVIVIVGVYSYIQLPREASPDVKIPWVLVMAPYSGTAPADMENLVTRKIEKQLKGIRDLKEMSSSSYYGVASIALEFTSDVDMSDALQRVRDRIELAKPELPADTREDLLIMELSAEDLWPVMQVNLSGDYDLFRLKKVGEDLQEAIEQIPGVLEAELTGGIENEVQVDVDPERLRFYGLGLVDVQDAVALQNITIPGGKLSLGQYDYQVRVPGEVDDVAQMLDFVVNPGIDPPVYLRDVATVRFGTADRESISRANGRDAVTLRVKKRTGENIITIAEGVRETIARLEPTFPPGTEVAIVTDMSKEIRRMVAELENNILSGLVLVVLVLLAFLGFKNSLFVGVAIPFSMLMSFIVLRTFGITLNMVVLFSLILALGMLVDNAIVIVENIYRHRVMGKGPEEGASFGANQVSAAVTASTLTTLCAFGPMLLWPGIMGEWMKYLPLTLIITLSCSLIVALIFNPVLCSRFMGVPSQDAQHPRLGDRLMALGMGTYRPTLRWALRHRGLVLGGITAAWLVVAGLFGAFNAGVELFPDTDPTFVMTKIRAPSGTRIEVSDVYAEQVEREVSRLDDLVAFTAGVGVSLDGGGGSAPSHNSMVTLEFVGKEDRSRSSRLAVDELRENLAGFTGAVVTVEKQEEGPPTGKPINIEIAGDDFDVLGELAARIKERIRGIAGVVNIEDNYDRALPEIELRPDIEKAGRYGLRTWDIAGTVRTALHGSETAKYRVGEDEYEVIVRYKRSFRRKVEDVESATVFYEGENIPVSAFATARFKTGLAAVHRIDAVRVVTVSADAAEGYNSNALLALVQQDLRELSLPPGYGISYTGENETQEESAAFLRETFMLAVMLILLVLISQFSSITIPVIIISSVALSFIGVFLGLMLLRMPFGIIMTGVGVISLAGIVVNNAIVLLDYIVQLRRRGLSVEEAILQAGETRFRPVILTAITTILGLIPLTTGLSIDFGRLFAGDFGRVLIIGGESSQWWGPMGVAVIWGLAVATFLTLVIVPVMYSANESFKDYLSGQLKRVRRQPAAATPVE